MRSQRIGRGFESRYLHTIRQMPASGVRKGHLPIFKVFWHGIFVHGFGISVLLFPILLTENDNSFRICLGRDASRSGSIIYHQKVVSDAAGKTLPVGRSYAGVGADIQFQLVFRRKQVFIKISDHYVLARFRAGDKRGLVLGRINQRNRLAGVIERGNAHACAQGGVIHDISARGKDKINHAIQSPDGYNLVAAFAPDGGDAFDNSGYPGVISSGSHKRSSVSFNINYAFQRKNVCKV